MGAQIVTASSPPLPKKAQAPWHGPKCPPVPPTDGSYPVLGALIDMLTNWPADEVSPPPRVFETLCRFQYQADAAAATAYRDAELPFVVYILNFITNIKCINANLCIYTYVSGCVSHSPILAQLYGVPSHDEAVNRWTAEYLSDVIRGPHNVEV